MKKIIIFFSGTVLGLVLLVLMIIIISTAGGGGNDSSESCEDKLSAEVIKLSDTVKEELNKQKIDVDKYQNLILALIQQESAGKGNDPMQSSESKCGSVGCINNVNESISAGITHIKNITVNISKKKLKETNELILQTYNFGIGYLDYLVSIKDSKYTENNALSYSISMCGTANTSEATAVNDNKKACYGDYMYVVRVSKYIEDNQCTSVFANGDWVAPYSSMAKVYITQKYNNKNPGLYGSIPHLGYDFDVVSGPSDILSIGNGVVVKAVDSNIGYGTHVAIKYSNNLFVYYGHMTTGSLKVKKGDIVMAGQKLGIQGSTGNSTGSHLHLECRLDITEIQSLSRTVDCDQFIKYRSWVVNP